MKYTRLLAFIGWLTYSSFLYAQPGAIDESFVTGTGTNDIVTSSAIVQDGKIIIGGYFTTYNGIQRSRIARLNADGSLDQTFDPGSGTNDKVRAISIQDDNKIIISGDFQNYNGTPINNIARLNEDGSLDNTFVIGNNWNVFSTAIQDDGKIVMGGQFDLKIARLNTDGSFDLSFDAGTGFTHSANAPVVAFKVALQSDGKILVAGQFTHYNSIETGSLARLNTDGSLDESFINSAIPGGVRTIAIQSDNKILIGGGFGVIRVNIDGTVDETFVNGSVDNTVNTIAIQDDGKIIIAGAFTSFNEISRQNIARLNSDGTLDETFDVGTGGEFMMGVESIQADGKIIIVGQFSKYHDTTVNNVARLIGGDCNDTYIPELPGLIDGMTSVCTGSETTYSITEVPRASSYTWTLPDGWTGSSTTNSITTTSGSTGGLITVIANNVCGSSDPQSLEVSVDSAIPSQPEAIDGPTEICDNAIDTYAILDVEGASSYTWTLPDGWTGVSTSNSIEVTALSTGGTISVTANNACGSSTEQVIDIILNQSVPDMPVSISGSTIVCDQITETYTITEVTGASSYTWTLPDGWTGTSSTNSIEATPVSSGGTISVTADNSCGSSTSQSLTVTTTVIDNSITVEENTITATVSDAVYQWLDCDRDFAEIEGETSQSFTANVTGNYAVRITKNECTVISNCESIVILGLTTLSESVSIFPNPFSSHLTIENKQVEKPIIFEIHNLMGALVLKGSLKNKASVNVDDFEPGIYIIHLDNGEVYKVLKSE